MVLCQVKAQGHCRFGLLASWRLPFPQDSGSTRGPHSPGCGRSTLCILWSGLSVCGTGGIGHWMQVCILVCHRHSIPDGPVHYSLPVQRGAWVRVGEVWTHEGDSSRILVFFSQDVVKFSGGNGEVATEVSLRLPETPRYHGPYPFVQCHVRGSRS